MSDRILVEFFSTCPGCRASEQLVRTLCSEVPWRDLVELVVHRLDERPEEAARYPGQLVGPGLCVSGRPVSPIGLYSIRKVLELMHANPRLTDSID